MPIAPVHRLKKTEIVRMAKWRCKHSHTGLEHFSCWLAEHPDEEKIGFFDIEASNLQADFGIVLTYAIKTHGIDEIFQRPITAKDLRTCLDENVVRQCIKDLSRYDRIVTYYGSVFDFPFVRTRAITMGIPFPEYGTLLHKDMYFAARGKLSLSSKRLENVCRVLFGRTEKTRIDSAYWIKALMGNKASLEYIADHCRKDVQELERVYDKMIGFGRRTDTSV